MKSDALKKNAFWILAGVAPFLTFLTFVVIFLSVGGEVASKSEAINKDLTELGGTKAKGTKGLGTMDKQKEVIAQQKQKLWEANWDQQLKLFTWPNNPDLKAFESKYQKFGEKMQVVNDELVTFKTKTTYEATFDRMAESVQPTVFAGTGWRGILRYVSEWGARTPSQTQVWLALEDIWVQKGLLEPIATVNASAGVFTAVDDGKDPLKRKFRSRVWDLDLEVPKEGKEAGKIVRAKLTNRTDRMQLLGNGKTMNLRVWLTEGGAPIPFRIEGAFLKANETLDVKPNENLHGIPTGAEVRKLSRVEHALDGRTVPIRRIDAMQLGKVDARHAAAILKAPKFIPEDAAVDPAAGGPPGPGGGVASAPGGDGGDGGGMMSGRGGLGGRGGAGVGANFGGPMVVLDANKKRYIDVTDQVRRMPVALVLVVDQMYLQDTLVAFANSSLRFQVTQYHWKRFRGTLASAADPSGLATPDGSDGVTGPPGTPTAGGFGGPPSGMPSGFGPRPPRGSSGPPSGSGFGPPSGSGFGSDSGGGFGLGGYGPGSAAGQGVSEAQATSGLVELSIYGIITLYEKYDAKVADGSAPPAAPPTPAAAAAPATPAAPPVNLGRD